LETKIFDNDVIRLRGAPKDPHDAADGKERLVGTLAWGDAIRVEGRRFELARREWDAAKRQYATRTYEGDLPKKARFRDGNLLKVRFIDVGQGDGTIVETPEGRIILIDGGEELHMRRYLNVAFSHVLKAKPLHCDAIVVTHGDADHFAGLTRLAEGFRNADSPLITASRVFHNGLVKSSAKKDVDAFGKTVKKDGETYVVDLVNNLIGIDAARMNKPFKDWEAALKRLKKESGGLEVRRLEYGEDAFDFLAGEGINVAVLGPIVEKVGGKPALRFLHTPGSKSLSASHTVNGHSVVLKLTFGNVRFLFGADLNEESEEALLERARADNTSLAAEVLKVPHHGSADFSPRILEAVRPVVSIVSSGDENATKEYIHPRAGLVGALGKYSRASVAKPLVYVTEMVAFFRRLGRLRGKQVGDEGKVKGEEFEINNAYEKSAFGIVHVRTDGERVLVTTNSGKDDQKETYAFRVDPRGEVEFEEKADIV
jgi:beta-lactamase superfamily II metal-dependent hydrolase